MVRAPESNRFRFGLVALAGAAAALGAGCSDPLQVRSTQELRRSILDSASRETREARSVPELRPLERRPSELAFPPERMAELNAMAGPGAGYGNADDLPRLG